jgi:uncharacterized protein (DUF1800 family)
MTRAPVTDQATANALRAHVLRRLTFGPRPGQVESLAEVTPDALIDQLLNDPVFEPDEPALGSDDDYSRLPGWWIDVMLDERAGLHERMTWFWHTHLTSSLDKASPALMYRQHRLLRQHAMGNFRDLLQAISIDAAMLYWLDGAGSDAEAPNENYSREMLELFSLGRDGGYTEADVRAGSKALAGWWVDGDSNDEVRFDNEHALSGSVSYLGGTVRTTEDVVNAACDHPSCAGYVAGKLHIHLLGHAPSDERRAELATVFSEAGLEIRPLVEAIVKHPSFLESRLDTPRSALEWFLAVRRFFDVEIDWRPLDALGQVPFYPPNVAGWPGTSRWVSVGSELAKAQLAFDSASETATLDEDDPVADVLARAALFDVGDDTRQALQDAADAVDSRRDRSSLLHALVAVSPEFSLN